jgi:ribosomal protein L15
MKISPNQMLFASILCFFKYDSVKIAANQVAKHCADVDAEDFKRVKFPECERGRQVVEGVSHAVGEAAYDEERHREEQRKKVLLFGKCHCSGHKKAAAYSESAKAKIEAAGGKAEVI